MFIENTITEKWVNPKLIGQDVNAFEGHWSPEIEDKEVKALLPDLLKIKTDFRPHIVHTIARALIQAKNQFNIETKSQLSEESIHNDLVVCAEQIIHILEITDTEVKIRNVKFRSKSSPSIFFIASEKLIHSFNEKPIETLQTALQHPEKSAMSMNLESNLEAEFETQINSALQSDILKAVSSDSFPLGAPLRATIQHLKSWKPKSAA